MASVSDVGEEGDEYEKEYSIDDYEGDGFVRWRFWFVIGVKASSGIRRRRGEKL